MRAFVYPAKIVYVYEANVLEAIIDLGFALRQKKTLRVDGLEVPSLRNPNDEDRRTALLAKKLVMDSFLNKDVYVATIKRSSNYYADVFLPGDSQHREAVVEVDGVPFVDLATYVKVLSRYDFDTKLSDV
jgi:hypothetical protein